jgi:PAS domain S-box-containing protein
MLFKDDHIKDVFGIFSEDYSKLILSGAPFGVAFFKLICDERGHPVDCELLDGNGQSKEIIGLRQPDDDGKPLSAAGRDKDFLNCMHHFGAVALAGGSRNFEYFSEHLDKWYHLLIYSQKQYYFVTLFFDITEEKKSKREQSAVCATDDILLKLDQDYVIRHCSVNDESFQNIQEIILDKKIGDILDNENTRKITQTLQRTRVSKKSQHVELTIDSAYGEGCYFIRAACLEEEGEHKYLLAVNGITNKVSLRNHNDMIAQTVQGGASRGGSGVMSYSTFFNTLDDMLLVADENGAILFANIALKEKTGYLDDDMFCLRIFDFVEKQNRQIAQMIYGEVCGGKREQHLIELVAKDKTKLLAETRIWAGTWSGQKCVFVLGKDVSENNGIMNRYQKIFDFNPSMMAVIGTKDLRLINVNFSFMMQLGFEREEVEGRTIDEIFGCLDVPPGKRKYLQARLQASERFADIEVPLRTKAGEQLRCLLSTQVVSDYPENQILLIFSKIVKKDAPSRAEICFFIEKMLLETSSELSMSPMDRADEVLQKSLSRLGEFFSAERTYLFKFSENHGCMDCTDEWYGADMVPKIKDLRNLSEKSMQSPLENFLEEYNICTESVNGFSESWTHENRHFQDKDIKYAFVVPVCLRHQLFGFIGFDFMNEAPEIDESVKNLLILYSQMIGAIWQREAGGEEYADGFSEAGANLNETTRGCREEKHLVADISHEIRTLINSVIGSSYLLQKTNPKISQEKYIQAIQSGGYALLEITNDILDATKTGRGKLSLRKTKFSIYDVVQDVIRLFELQANQKGIEIASYIDRRIPGELTGDKSGLGQLLNNLVGNAVKFTNKGTIRVLCELVKMDDRVADVRIKVEDSGPGIEKEDTVNIFDEFWQGNHFDQSGTEGTGLGLPICKRIVEVMGGRIDVDTEAGRGCSFQIVLPIEISDANTPYTIDCVAADELVVWIYDDNDYNGTYAAKTFLDYGIDCRVNVARDELLSSICSNNKLNVFLIDSAFKGQGLVSVIYGLERETGAVFCMAKAGDIARMDDENVQKSIVSKPLTAPVLFNELLPRLENYAVRKHETREAFLDTKILIVDDSEIQMDIVSAILKQYGIDCDCAGTGEEALLEAKETAYDLILMNIHMSSMNGIEVARRIRSRKSNASKPAPILALTAQEISENLWEAMNIDGYVTTPVDSATLFSALKPWLSHKMISRHPDTESDPMPSGSCRRAEVLDVKEGLKVLSNDESLYKDLLKKLLNTNLVQLAEVKKLYAKKEYQAIFTLLHSVKAAFGSLGAYELYQEILYLENQIKKNPHAAQSSFKNLDCCISRLRNEINRFFDNEYLQV